MTGLVTLCSASGLGEIKASESEVSQEKTEAGARHGDPAPRVKACLPSCRASLLMLYVEQVKDRRSRRDNGRGRNAAME
jgi:hypothetical protein